jgi:hypothetical protein
MYPLLVLVVLALVATVITLFMGLQALTVAPTPSAPRHHLPRDVTTNSERSHELIRAPSQWAIRTVGICRLWPASLQRMLRLLQATALLP